MQIDMGRETGHLRSRGDSVGNLQKPPMHVNVPNAQRVISFFDHLRLTVHLQPNLREHGEHVLVEANTFTQRVGSSGCNFEIVN
jgi:hypothetical protein